jgi:UDP-N-acetylmuramate--alanine ligase
VVTYGTSPQAHVVARDVESGPQGSRFTAVAGGIELGRIELPVPGAHNVINSLAAVAAGLELDIPFARIAEGLAAFTGVDRRFQVRGEAGGVLVVDDYGHHPVEVTVTLETLRTVAGARRTLVLFQPHRYTRTRDLWDDFCRSFHLADCLLVTDIYAASESPLDGVTAQALAEAIAARGHRQVRYVGDLDAATKALAREARNGDVVLTLGAGSVWHAGEALLESRARKKKAPAKRGKKA